MVSHKDSTEQVKTDRISYDSPAVALRKALHRATADRKECESYLLEPCVNKMETEEAHADTSSSDPESPPGGSSEVAASATKVRLRVPTSEGVPDAWIADTGSGYDLVSKNEISEKILGQVEVPSHAPNL